VGDSLAKGFLRDGTLSSVAEVLEYGYLAEGVAIGSDDRVDKNRAAEGAIKVRGRWDCEQINL
jgi:hypothetical protein